MHDKIEQMDKNRKKLNILYDAAKQEYKLLEDKIN